MKYVSSREEIPTTPHIAVIVFDSIYVPGDERSRTCPGHGYPERYESTIKYIILSESEFEDWAKGRREETYAVVSAKKLTVTTKTTISLS